MSAYVLEILGGQQISGVKRVQGSKNAALPILAATVLNDGIVTLDNLPLIDDISFMLDILKVCNADVTYVDSQLVINSNKVYSSIVPYALCSKMRASILLLGPLLARYGKARVSMPGGCIIGSRLIDMHLDGLRALGAAIEIEGGYVIASAPKGLVGNTIHFNQVSVGATENIVMAASLAKGQTSIVNAAREPEIVDLVNFLNKSGAKIYGAGTSLITVEGVDNLLGVSYKVISDRIEAGSYAIAALATKGTVILENFNTDFWGSFNEILLQMGAVVQVLDKTKVQISYKDTIDPVHVVTAPYPGFTTDLHPLLTTLLLSASGRSSILENIFESRFSYVSELYRLGADIHIKNNMIFINPSPYLVGADLKAKDLRAGFALIIAGLMSEGKTIIHNISHLYRGYSNFIEDMKSLNIQIIKKGKNDK